MYIVSYISIHGQVYIALKICEIVLFLYNLQCVYKCVDGRYPIHCMDRILVGRWRLQCREDYMGCGIVIGLGAPTYTMV